MPGLIPLVLNTECISSSPSSPPRRSVCLSPTSATMPASSRVPAPLVLDFSTVLDVSFPVPKPSPKTPSFPKPTYPVRRSSLASMSSERAPSRAICTSPSTRKAPLSLPSLPSSSSDFASPTTPPSPSCSSPKSSLLMSTSLASIPYTAEWCKAIAEVKRQFHGRQYRECAARCTEILENVRDLSQVEPIYVISLNFYAASALEANALSLPSSSAFRMSLLQKSRSHYLKTSDLLQDADDGTSESWRRLSVSTSSSSISTPISSLSRTWTPSMCSSSRSPSICSLEEPKDVPAPPPIKKRVTFSCDLEDPVIRPDSPTLGFDDFLGRESPEPVIIPRVPMHITTMPPSALKQPKPASPASSAGSPIFESHSFFDSEIPISRLCALLSSLRLEVASHLAAVEAMVSAPEQDRNVSTSASSGRSTPIEAFKDSSEMRSLDIKARIERLRSNNWERRRFDAGKYRALAASALAELE
ncbi:hypothetical protein CFIMG_001072RA [Ceratocystis fimbriata CBS 114723]|uniref:Uncharacterized protein n=1 Tax=Ceratocystis fimbriata CBS 114723 TaxID=1035309 RepID=A0A2C5XG13_9PEZI|nr:hypothetical protein CFIMG_001072RA [Ceratocystis fimbriata CBS 114723]